MAYKKAHFKTAYLQRAEVFDAKTSEALEVGALATYNHLTNTFAGSNTIEDATHIMAQSDMTVDKGHVPVENRDYRYNPAIAISSATPKKIVAYPILDDLDVELDVEG